MKTKLRAKEACAVIESRVGVAIDRRTLERSDAPRYSFLGGTYYDPDELGEWAAKQLQRALVRPLKRSMTKRLPSQ